MSSNQDTVRVVQDAAPVRPVERAEPAQVAELAGPAVLAVHAAPVASWIFSTHVMQAGIWKCDIPSCMYCRTVGRRCTMIRERTGSVV